MKQIVIIFGICILISFQSLASDCGTKHSLVGDCYETRGRLQFSDRTPPIQIWKVGTKRLLGVSNENLAILPEKVKEKFTPGVVVFADYKVCPLTPEQPGTMQMVCIESMTNIRIEDFRENPDKPEITIIKNDPAQPPKIETDSEEQNPVNETEHVPASGTGIVLILIAIIILTIAVIVILRVLYLRSKKEQIQYSAPRFKADPQTESAPTPVPNNLALPVNDPALNFPKVRIKRVIDGNRMIVIKNNQNLEIRLYAIDCPELEQAWGKTAQHGLIKLIEGCNVLLEEHGTDRHGRKTGTLYVRQKAGSTWKNVNERMIALGHAWIKRDGDTHLPRKRQVKLDHLESWAQSKKIGLWKITNPTPPWEWREMMNKKPI